MTAAHDERHFGLARFKIFDPAGRRIESAG